MISVLLCFAFTAFGRIAEPGFNMVGLSQHWAYDSLPAQDHILELIIVLQRDESSLAELEKLFWEVSNPKHEKYGQYLTQSEVTELINIPAQRLEAVLQWLAAESSAESHVGAHRDLIKVKIPVRDAEKLFGVTLYTYRSTEYPDEKIVRANGWYTIPEIVSSSIYMVDNLLNFPRIQRPITVLPTVEEYNTFPASTSCGGQCSGKVTPGVLTQAYSLGNPVALGDAKGSMAVAEFQGVYWSNSELKIFNQACDVNATIDVQDGKNQASECDNRLTGSICTEALLDIEYIRGVAGAVPLTDVFVLEYSLLGWAKQLEDMADGVLPLIHSVSYGNDEAQQTSAEYMRSCNTEFQKLAVRGISILFASGDQGVWGREGEGIFRKKYHPDFPAASPYITAVGGTDFLTKGVIGPETSWDASGGGFSDTFGIPDFQKDHVTSYKKNANLPPSSRYNDTGRGYPDVSALGGLVNPYCVATSERLAGVAGTSASCPVVAGVVAKLNELRLAAGKAPLGYLNQFFYQNADAFNDVTHGRNGAGSSTEGFEAIEGWDPATGLGTPNFAKLKTRV